MTERPNDSSVASLPRRVLVSGASGLIGHALVPQLRARGWRVHPLVRRPAGTPDEVAWQPEAGRLLWPREAGFDAVIHLAGANLADGRWTRHRKQLIRDSRIASTRTLVSAILRAPVRPGVLLAASAVGYYGDTGEREVTETAEPGRGFLAGVCREWEAELAPAEAAGVRVVALRSGVVLSREGGALARMLPVFRAGLGGRLGDGRQWMSWITLDDWVALACRALTDTAWSGAVNAVAPNPVRNADYTAALARALRRPAVFTVPAPLLRWTFGELADAALLSSTRAVPAKALALGLAFRWPLIEPAMDYLVGRGAVARRP